MHRSFYCSLALAVLVSACGSRRLQGYLDSLAEQTTGTDDASESSQGSDTGENDTDAVADTSTSGTTAATASTSEATEPETSETIDPDTATTTEPYGPECGNGILEPFGPVPEECDDGNLDPDDGCSTTCALDRQVFVTSGLYHGWELTSLYIANGLCASTAAAQGLAEPLSYRAWLSDSTEDARDRILRGRGRLVLVNGLVFANSWDALFAGQIENPLEVTEASQTYQGGVWTGTQPDGTAVPGSEHCDDWSTDSVLTTGHWGRSGMSTAEWTLAVSDVAQPAFCNGFFAIYCFQSL